MKDAGPHNTPNAKRAKAKRASAPAQPRKKSAPKPQAEELSESNQTQAFLESTVTLRATYWTLPILATSLGPNKQTKREMMNALKEWLKSARPPYSYPVRIECGPIHYEGGK